VGYQGKINAAYECGQETHFNQPGYPKGGMGLLEKIVHDNLGVNINYYALINYTAFKDSVNAVGGITINLQTGDPRGIYDPTFDWECHYTCHKVDFPNGNLTLNGDQALDLARARGDFGGYGAGNDFGRTQRQRQMLVAIKNKALSAGTFSNPIALTKLMDTVGNNVHTDFKPAEVHRLFDLGKDINSNDIQSEGLTTDNYLTSYTSGGQSALAPKTGVDDFSDIQAYLKRILSSDPAAQEDAHIVVLNGSDHAGLASTQAQQLSNTFTVDNIGNAGGTYQTTEVFDLTGKKPAARSRLEQTYHVTAKSKKDLPPSEQGYDSDFVIILGNDVVSQ
jgi:LCP family protein required for cell wall assembly